MRNYITGVAVPRQFDVVTTLFYGQADNAIALAKSIKGVKQVDSKIEVLIGPSK